MEASMLDTVGVTIRPCRAEDDSFLFELFTSVRAAEFASLNWDPAQLDALLRMQFAAQTQSYAATYPDAGHGIICEKDAPIGRILTHETDEEIHLVDIALLPPWRNHGIGTAMIRALQARARKGAKPLRLNVAETNRAMGLYTRLGFVPCGHTGVHLTMEWPASRFERVGRIVGPIS